MISLLRKLISGNDSKQNRSLEEVYAKNSFDKQLLWHWKQINYNRIALVNLLVAQKSIRCRYLEIGCDTNTLFNSVPVPDKTGVDPIVGGNVRKTSDKFFNDNSVKFDVIFIDGLHTYEQVRKDSINAIQALNDGGWIAFHDFLPRTWKEQHVPRLQGEWTGDVWKHAFELAESDDIDFRIIKADHGLGVFRLKKKNPVIADLQKELADKQFDYFFNNMDRLPIVDWDEAVAWITS